jgi:TorA maturation chaperone TorD
MTQDDSLALAGTYRLLARIWGKELDLPFLERLQSPPLREAFEMAGGRVPLEDVDTLARDYCQLLIGPANHLPPYQSVWEAGRLDSNVVQSVAEFADAAGYAVQDLPDGTMLDHLGVQLDILAFINEQLGAATDSEQLAALEEMAAAFFARHLLWSRSLLDAAIPRAETDFYRSVVQLTRDFIQSGLLSQSGLPTTISDDE